MFLYSFFKKNLKFFKQNIIDGNINTFGNSEIIIGKQLAIELDVVVGDKINIMSSSLVSTPLGSVPQQSIFTISSVFSSGLYEFDKNIKLLDAKYLDKDRAKDLIKFS